MERPHSKATIKENEEKYSDSTRLWISMQCTYTSDCTAEKHNISCHKYLSKLLAGWGEII